MLGAIIATLFLGAFAFADVRTTLARPDAAINSIPFSTRAFWMRQVNAILVQSGSPCPFSAFASVIVNHTAPGLGTLVCTGVNSNRQTGDPTLHGEIAAIQNCSKVLTDPAGEFRFTPTQALNAFSQLSLYTNAESCSMCASAIRWSSFREYIFGTSIETLITAGWGQIRISSFEVFQQSFELPSPARLLGNVLTNETDPLLTWQFNPDAPCPSGCARTRTGSCGPSLV
ncbi:cytidine deaminase-like protein [Exidia glandulosa HHB12029]|uniref:Cytidine deaminase-like protein n=1 Tax=Exidia glandulosa HHB12029 TaxID=1314781 RepID=A0A165H736_EXIGL|nr:cytidine deaminase-like protein [Exidia glandulosa HHB12029]